MQPPEIFPLPDDMRQKAIAILLETASEFDVPPAYIVAHSRRYPKAAPARRKAMRRMKSEIKGMTRLLLAAAFNRDLRRVRASVIGA